jgi:hypothetical protein
MVSSIGTTNQEKIRVQRKKARSHIAYHITNKIRRHGKYHDTNEGKKLRLTQQEKDKGTVRKAYTTVETYSFGCQKNEKLVKPAADAKKKEQQPEKANTKEKPCR